MLRRRHHPRDRPQAFATCRPAPPLRSRGEQADRVRVPRMGEECSRRCLLDDPAGIHHGDVVAGLGHHAEIVRDEQDRRAEPLPQIGEQVEDLSLDRDIERGGRLVGDDEIGLAGQRHGDHHPLSHAARELVGILVEPSPGIGHPHQFEHLERPAPCLGPRHIAMQEHRLGDLVADREDGIEARHRLLEDHPDAATAHRPQLRLGQRHQIQHVATGIPKQNLARLDHARCCHEPEDRHRGHTLPAAAFADEPERLAPFDRQRDPVHRRHAAGGGVEGGHQVIDFKKRHACTR